MSPMSAESQAFGQDTKTALVHKLADLSAATKQVKRLRSEVTDLRKHLETSSQSVDGIDFSALAAGGELEREALKRRVALLTELCEQNGVVIPPTDAYNSSVMSAAGSGSGGGIGGGSGGKAADGNVMELIARACEVPMDTVPGLVSGLLKEVKGTLFHWHYGPREHDAYSLELCRRPRTRAATCQAAQCWPPAGPSLPASAAAAAAPAAGIRVLRPADPVQPHDGTPSQRGGAAYEAVQAAGARTRQAI